MRLPITASNLENILKVLLSVCTYNFEAYLHVFAPAYRVVFLVFWILRGGEITEWKNNQYKNLEYL